MDERLDAFQADVLHVGCDEVFEIGHCPRCRGIPTATLLADWINTHKLTGVLQPSWYASACICSALLDKPGCGDEQARQVAASLLGGEHAVVEVARERSLVACEGGGFRGVDVVHGLAVLDLSCRQTLHNVGAFSR